MEHRLLYSAVEAFLLAERAAAAADATPLAMLDLGCGDALLISRTLQRCCCNGCGGSGRGLKLGSYTGVDVAPPALALAADHLAFLRQQRCKVRLVEVRSG